LKCARASSFEALCKVKPLYVLLFIVQNLHAFQDVHNLKSDLAQQKTHFLAELKKAEVASKPHEAKVGGAVMDQIKTYTLYVFNIFKSHNQNIVRPSTLLRPFYTIRRQKIKV